MSWKNCLLSKILQKSSLMRPTSSLTHRNVVVPGSCCCIRHEVLPSSDDEWRNIFLNLQNTRIKIYQILPGWWKQDWTMFCCSPPTWLLSSCSKAEPAANGWTGILLCSIYLLETRDFGWTIHDEGKHYKFSSNHSTTLEKHTFFTDFWIIHCWGNSLHSPHTWLRPQVTKAAFTLQA